jgi:hypothetical protein
MAQPRYLPSWKVTAFLSDMENDGTTRNREAAAAQLAALRSGRAQMAERAMQPWWYDVALGLLVFQAIASYSAHEDWVTVVAALVLGVGCLALMTAYKRITGFWVNGWRRGPTRRAVWVWVVGYLVVLALAAGAEYELGWRGAMVAGGAVLGVGIALTSRWWSRIYITELREGL